MTAVKKRREGRQRQQSALALAVCAGLVAVVALLGGGATAAQAGSPQDAVLEWNLHATDALINAPTAPVPGVGQTPPVAMLHLAMVQGAVYDAVNMIDGGYQPYLAGLPPASESASKAAAVATAARDVLVGAVMVPALSSAIVTRLDDLRDASLAAATTQDGSEAVAEGVAAGEAAAEAMLEERAHDGRYGTFTFTPGFGIGEWRPTSGVVDPFAWVARVDPFVLESTSQFRTKGPHALKSGAYAKEYEEVKDYGGNETTTPTLRTADQTALARFYTVHPGELFNRTFRTLAEARGLQLVEQARLFAMLDIAAADSLIGCWDDKAFWNFWRPVTAIHEGDDDGNDHTVGDTAWTPLVTTPPYPDHPSGYNCASSGFMYAAEAFFGNGKLPFGVTANVGTPPVPVTRDYERFTDVLDDTIDARIYLGLHFRAPDVQAVGIGKDVAHWLDTHYFRRAKG